MSEADKGRESAGEVLYEFRPIGRQVRVAAIDPATGVEVVIMAPATASQADMQKVAAAKLRRRLAASGQSEDGLDSARRV